MFTSRGGTSRSREAALAVLGPLESRIMRLVWKGSVGERFVVRDVQALMPELAYTTVMTTLNRLAQKGILRTKAVRQQRAHEYRCAMSPDEFLRLTSQRRVRDLVRRYGDAALAAFAASLDELSPEDRKRLREMGRP